MAEYSPVVAKAHPAANYLVLYDGVCGLCNRMVQFVVRRDPARQFRFAALQGETAKRILARYGAATGNFETVCVVTNFDQADERLLQESEAVIFILGHLGVSTPFWHFAVLLPAIVPKRLLDWGYGFVARHRYRIFGRYDTCPLPSENEQWRFLDR